MRITTAMTHALYSQDIINNIHTSQRLKHEKLQTLSIVNNHVGIRFSNEAVASALRYR